MLGWGPGRPPAAWLYPKLIAHPLSYLQSCKGLCPQTHSRGIQGQGSPKAPAGGNYFPTASSQEPFSKALPEGERLPKPALRRGLAPRSQGDPCDTTLLVQNHLPKKAEGTPRHVRPEVRSICRACYAAGSRARECMEQHAPGTAGGRPPPKAVR